MEDEKIMPVRISLFKEGTRFGHSSSVQDKSTQVVTLSIPVKRGFEITIDEDGVEKKITSPVECITPLGQERKKFIIITKNSVYILTIL